MNFLYTNGDSTHISMKTKHIYEKLCSSTSSLLQHKRFDSSEAAVISLENHIS